MKINNIERGKEIVYVQNNDLLYIKYINIAVPEEISLAVRLITDDNLSEFVPFYGEEARDFFKRSSWIIDYREVKTLSIEEIRLVGQTLANEVNKISTLYYGLDVEERSREKDLVSLYFIKKHKMEELAVMSRKKQGAIAFSLPEKPDYYNSLLRGFENNDYYLVMGLNPNQFFLYRKDNKPFQENEKIPVSLLDAGILALAASSSEDKISLEDVESTSFISEDHTYYLTEVNLESTKKPESTFSKYHYNSSQKNATF